MIMFQTRKLVLLGALFTLGYGSAFALEPVTDQTLAQSSGQNSIVVPISEKAKKRFSIEEDSAKRETPAYEALRVASLNYPNKLDIESGEQKSNKTLEFGSEAYSLLWSGNAQYVIDLEQYSNTTFSNSTGQYEINNVQGKVIIDVDTY